MKRGVNRRRFLQRSLGAATLAGGMTSFEEAALLGQTSPAGPAPEPDTGASGALPTGRIGKVVLSRLICGGNLISGFAHSRDLLYVSTLLKRYFTDEKVWETLALCEAHGINTAILRLDEDTLRVLRGYWKQRAGKIQWICQVKIQESDLTTEIRKAVDHGAVGVFVHGGVADDWVQRGKVELLGAALDFIRRQGVIAGVAGHALEVPKACEAAGLSPDFYMKTFNSQQYWSAGPQPRFDSVWEETPNATRAFMHDVARPWIAYKVLGAGAIHPREGFRYAFENGADFLCVGMFDFQVAEDAAIARDAHARAASRLRDWYG